jgi:hypothetical protein
MPDPIIFLNNIFALVLMKIAGKATGAIVDALAKCFFCPEEFNVHISNVNNNYIECPCCKRLVNQFINVCPFTLNRSTNEIGQALFHPRQQKSSRALYKNSNKQVIVTIPSLVLSKDIIHKELILETTLKSYGFKVAGPYYEIIKPTTYDYITYLDHHIQGAVLNQNSRTVINSKIRSAYNDVLYERTTVVEPGKVFPRK